MQLRQCLLELGVNRSRGFENRQHLAGGFHLAFPAVNRLHRRDEIHTGRELPFDKCRANLTRLLAIGKGAKDQKNIIHASS